GSRPRRTMTTLFPNEVPMPKNQTRLAVVAAGLLSLSVSVHGATCTDWRWANPLPQGNRLSGVAHGNGVFVAVGGGGVLLVSPDGETWSLGLSGTKRDLFDVVWSGSGFIAVGASGTVLSSSDGLSWVARASGETATLRRAVWAGRQFVVVGDSGA